MDNGLAQIKGLPSAGASIHRITGNIARKSLPIGNGLKIFRVHGRHIDIYMWSFYEALSFGRQPVHLVVLRLGWNPRAARPSVIGHVPRAISFAP